MDDVGLTSFGDTEIARDSNSVPPAITIFRAAAVAVLAFLVPIWLSNGSSWSRSASMAALCACYSGIRFSWISLSGDVRLMAAFRWLFFYIFFGLAPLVQINENTWPLGGAISEDLLQRTLGYTLLFMFSSDIGSYVALRNQHESRDKENFPTVRLTLAGGRLFWLGIFSMSAALYELHRIGGLRVLFTSRETLSAAIGGVQASDTSSPGAAIHFALLGLPVFVTAYLLVSGIRAGRFRGWRTFTFGMVTFALILTNPITSSRYGLGTVVIGLVLACLSPLGVRGYRVLMVTSAFGLLFAFRVFNEFRFADRSNPEAISFDLRTQLIQGDYDAFQQFVNTLILVKDTGLHPRQALGPPLFWLPRSVWPGKPTDTGALVGAHMKYRFVNLSAPVPAELFIAGGVVAIAIGGLLIGYWWARLDVVAQQGQPLTLTRLIIPILAVYQFILLRGSLLQAVGSLIVIVLLLRFSCGPSRNVHNDVEASN